MSTSFEKPARDYENEKHRRETMSKSDMYHERSKVFATAKSRALKRVEKYRSEMKKR